MSQTFIELSWKGTFSRPFFFGGSCLICKLFCCSLFQIFDPNQKRRKTFLEIDFFEVYVEALTFFLDVDLKLRNQQPKLLNLSCGLPEFMPWFEDLLHGDIN